MMLLQPFYYKQFKLLVFFLCVPLLLLGQQQNITGTVNDVQGGALPGVNVVVKGTTNGVQTSVDGKFSIKANTGQTLVFSFIGMKTQEVILTNQTNYTISLEQESSTLEEIVVVGYGEVKKSDVTGSITSVTSEELNSRPIANALQGIQGKAAGVDIGSNERPGQLGSITIRGVRSLTASNSPLYVVDGIPLTTGGIDNINPTDIESIDVLKDASATAIFGSRGANGVVIVTTKRGKSGKFTLNVTSALTIETLQNRAKLMNASDYIDYRRWAKHYSNQTLYPRGDQPNEANDFDIFVGSSDPAAWENIKKGWNGTSWDGSKVTSTDWVGLVTQTAVTSQTTLSASGGTEKIKAYGSFGYLNNDGTVKGQGFKRYTGKISVDIDAAKWFKFGGSLNTTYGVNEYGQSTAGRNSLVDQSGLYGAGRTLFSYAVPYDKDGNRIEFPGGDIAVKTVVDEVKYSQDQRVNIRAFGSFYSEVNFGGFTDALKGLKYRVNFGPDISNSKNGVFLDSKSVVRAGSSYAYLGKSTSLSYTLDHLLYYNKEIGKHNFGVTLLGSQTRYSADSSSMDANNIPFPSQKWNALTTSNLTLNSWNSDLTEKQLRSFMGRVNYDFDGRFLITASGRYDGASQLSAGNKWAFFPSMALGWRIDRERFFSAVHFVDQLKLRVGVGVTGNSAINPYSTKGGLVPLFYPNGSTLLSGVNNSSTLANANLGWEKTTQYNFGTDFSIFGRKLSGSLDYYTSRTTDLLLLKTIPSVTGFINTYANIGETASQGVDFTLNTTLIRSKSFEWNASLNASWQDNHIISLANGKEDDINNNWFINQSQGVIYGYESNGIWQASDTEEINKFNANGHSFSQGFSRPVDQNGDYKIDANNDRVIIGSTIPKYILGLTNTFNYKNLDLSIFLYGRLGYTYNTGGEGLTGRFNARAVDYYTEINTDAEYQKPFYTAGTGDAFSQTLGYRSGSFVKIRNISLGYRLTDKMSKKIGLTGARFYAQALNPGMLFSKISWIDMDLVSSAWNRGFTFGLSIDI
jgi:TonB-linked SusC/RagA family outer membrane protein